jgi:integrase
MNLVNPKSKNEYLFPKISLSRLNIQLKRLAELAGWTEQISVNRGKKGVPKKIQLNNKPYRFCDLVTSHIMRRTAITTMLTFDVNEHVVRSISGHSPSSKEFHRYVNIAQVYKDKQLDAMHKNLKGLSQDLLNFE